MASHNPILQLATHEVTNQPPPLEGYNLYARDAALSEALRREGVVIVACLQAWHGQGLADIAALADVEWAQSSMTVGIALQNAGFALVTV